MRRVMYDEERDVREARRWEVDFSDGVWVRGVLVSYAGGKGRKEKRTYFNSNLFQ